MLGSGLRISAVQLYSTVYITLYCVFLTVQCNKSSVLAAFRFHFLFFCDVVSLASYPLGCVVASPSPRWVHSVLVSTWQGVDGRRETSQSSDPDNSMRSPGSSLPAVPVCERPLDVLLKSCSASV